MSHWGGRMRQMPELFLGPHLFMHFTADPTSPSPLTLLRACVASELCAVQPTSEQINCGMQAGSYTEYECKHTKKNFAISFLLALAVIAKATAPKANKTKQTLGA